MNKSESLRKLREQERALVSQIAQVEQLSNQLKSELTALRNKIAQLEKMPPLVETASHSQLRDVRLQPDR
jgi:phage shock protein A